MKANNKHRYQQKDKNKKKKKKTLSPANQACDDRSDWLHNDSILDACIEVAGAVATSASIFAKYE